MGTLSRRAFLTIAALGAGTVGTRHYEPEREASFQHTAATQRYIQSLPDAITLTG